MLNLENVSCAVAWRAHRKPLRPPTPSECRTSAGRASLRKDGCGCIRARPAWTPARAATPHGVAGPFPVVAQTERTCEAARQTSGREYTSLLGYRLAGNQHLLKAAHHFPSKKRHSTS